MRIAHLKIAVFALFLLAPVAMLLPFGGITSYGRAQTEFPPVVKLLLGKKGRFDKFGDAVLERSVVQRLAIELRNFVSYSLVGFVDNERLVSGADDWLFYRPEFNGGRCLDEDQTVPRLRGMAVLMDIGRAAGIDMVMAMAPDKSTVYPEKLNPAMRGYWRCRVENSAAIRRLIKKELPGLIDHAEPLLAEKMRHPEIALYYRTDTHWTPYGGAIALRQLLAAVYPEARIPAPRLSAVVASEKTDLARMLLLSIEEHGPMAEPLLARDIGNVPGDQPAPQTLIIHDSFYQAIAQQIYEAFPEPVKLLSFSQDNRLRADGLPADRLIISAIERKFVTREGDVLGWDGDVAIAIVNRNMQRAQDCGDFMAADAAAPGAKTIAVRAVAAGNLPCLRLSVAAKKRAMLKIALPDPETGAFESGRMLEYQLARGAQTVAFVLPSYAAGAKIRISLEKAALSAIEVGEIRAARPAVGGQP